MYVLSNMECSDGLFYINMFLIEHSHMKLVGKSAYTIFWL